MPFDNEVFVSYAHIDDQVLAEGHTGWISSLHRALEVRLAQLLGKEAKVWRDPKLSGNDVFADCLVEKLPRVAALVSVISPRYVKSEWCQRELTEFIKAATATGPLRVGDKSRVFKVVKTPVPPQQHPGPLQEVIGYEFYTLESASARPRELSPNDAPETQRLYWAKLDDLAHDICDLVQQLDDSGDQDAETRHNGDTEKGTVFLAETSSDLKEKRDMLRRELIDHGYTVVPDRPLPLIGDECAAYVAEELARCQLSVHMVGTNYGVVPEGSTESIVALQNELAIKRGEAGDFCRLIWIPPEMSICCPRQRAFVEQLQNDARIQTGGDLLMTPLEDFKNVLHARLEPPQAPPATEERAVVGSPATDDQPRRVYMICDQRDLEHVTALEDYLFERGCEVVLPAFDGDEAQLRRDHEENLTMCDAALVYYGAANELWLRSKLRDLQKIAGYGRTAPLRAKAIYVAPPDSCQKQRFRTHEAMVLRGADTLDAESIAPFLAALE